jgi:tetratricopeptide (TPR) repeat protein
LAQAAVSLHNALLGYEEKGDKGGVANASNQLGHVCFAKEDFTSAEKHYLRAQELCRELGDQLSLFSLLKRFVEVYRGLKDYEKAVKLSFDILDTYYANNDPRGTVSALENLADIYLDAGQPDKAADSLRTIASIHRNFGHKSIADSFERKASELEPGA